MKKGDIKVNREGEISQNNKGTKMKIIKYNGATDIVVEFQDGNKYTTHSTYNHFKKGTINNVYNVSVEGIGYVGYGRYTHRDNKINYDKWREMLKRCYNEDYKQKYPTYIGCVVCEEWLNFQNFAKWFDEAYYEVGEEHMHLDKDILYKGNKIYNPETCVFVPERVNTLFTKRDNDRGAYPIGVNYNKGRYEARCNNSFAKPIYLGSYASSIEAFKEYKRFKECEIKKVADKYKDKIPKDIYESMCEYMVEITD